MAAVLMMIDDSSSKVVLAGRPGRVRCCMLCVIYRKEGIEGECPALLPAGIAISIPSYMYRERYPKKEK